MQAQKCKDMRFWFVKTQESTAESSRDATDVHAAAAKYQNFSLEDTEAKLDSSKFSKLCPAKLLSFFCSKFSARLRVSDPNTRESVADYTSAPRDLPNSADQHNS